MKARASFSAGWRLKLWPVIALVAIGVAVVATVATASEEHRFRAGYDLSWVEWDRCYEVWSGPGLYWIDNTPYPSSAVVHMHVMGKKLVGYVTITADGTGDQIYYTTEMTRSDNHAMDWVGTYVITGGTGLFANATGAGTDGHNIGADGTICF